MASDAKPSDEWTCRHFSLTNGDGKHASDLPRLLRRVAKRIEARGITPMELMDVTIQQEMTADGPYWSATVYYSQRV